MPLTTRWTTIAESQFPWERANWQQLVEIGDSNASSRPNTLDGWLEIFAGIYPSSDTEQYPATFGRFSEEVGEVAEAVRVFPVAPGYFLSEGADLFAWLMHLHGVVSAKNEAHGKPPLPSLQQGFAEMYPAMCKDCGRRVCTCPPILPKTLGRIAHEVPTSGSPFAPGGALLSTSEALALFSLGSREVTLGDARIPVSEDLIRGIHSLVVAVQDELTGQQDVMAGVSAGRRGNTGQSSGECRRTETDPGANHRTCGGIPTDALSRAGCCPQHPG